MFDTYGPKLKDVQAVQITPENSEDIVQTFHGRWRTTDTGRVLVEIPSFDGVLSIGEGDYLVKREDGTFTVEGKDVFEAKYDVTVPAAPTQNVFTQDELELHPEDIREAHRVQDSHTSHWPPTWLDN